MAVLVVPSTRLLAGHPSRIDISLDLGLRHRTLRDVTTRGTRHDMTTTTTITGRGGDDIDLEL